MITAEEYLPLVERIAASACRKLPRCVDKDDLIQWGYFGLRNAIARYDPSRGVKFSCYAYRHISGAMTDGLRGVDPMPRSARKREDCPKEISINNFVDTPDWNRTDSTIPKACRISDLLEDSSTERPGIAIGEHDALEKLLRPLPDRTKIIMRLIYRDGLDQHTAAVAIGLTESRVSQLHKDALAILKAQGEPT